LNRKFRVDTRSQSSDSTRILELNLLTWLKYLSQEFWLKSSLDESSTRLDAISLIMCCKTLHDFCTVTDVNVSFLMLNIENELCWISLFRLLFMFIWFISVWMSISSSFQCADAQLAIETNHVHHQSSCSSLYFQVLLHVSSLDVASAWLLKIKCSHMQSELIADMFDLLLIS